MGRGATKTGIRQRCTTYGVMFSLAAYFLNLCTLSPRVHAASAGRLSSDQQASAEHCAQSRGAAQSPASGVADHEQKEDPFCCDLRSAHNKVIPSFLILADFLPVVAHLFLPSSAKTLADHKAVADFYRVEGSRLQREAEQHAGLVKKAVSEASGQMPWASHHYEWAEHCRKLADSLGQAAQEAQALAKIHESLAQSSVGDKK